MMTPNEMRNEMAREAKEPDPFAGVPVTSLFTRKAIVEQRAARSDKWFTLFIIVILGLMVLPFFFSAAGCCTIQTGPPNDLTPYNDCMTTQMGYMLIDQLPRILK